MSDGTTDQRVRDWLNQLTKQAQDRSLGEEKLHKLAVDLESRKRAFTQRQQEIDREHRGTIEKLNAEYQKVKADHESRYNKQLRELKQRYEGQKEQFESEHEDEQRKQEESRKEQRWTVDTIHNGRRDDARREREDTDKLTDQIMNRMEESKANIDHYLEELRAGNLIVHDVPTSDAVDAPANAIESAEAELTNLTALEKKIKGIFLPKLFINHRFEWVVFALGIVSVYPFIRFLGGFGYAPIWGVGAAVAMTLIGGGVLGALLYFAGKASVKRNYQSAITTFSKGKVLGAIAKMQSSDKLEMVRKQLREERDQEFGTIEKNYKQALRLAQGTLEQSQARIFQDLQASLQKLSADKEAQSKEIEERFPKRIAQLEADRDQKLTKLTADHEAFLQQHTQTQQQLWEQVSSNWRAAVAHAKQEAEQIRVDSAKLFPDWPEQLSGHASFATEIPPNVRMGEITVRPQDIPKSAPTHAELKEDVLQTETLPALLPFPRGCSVFVKAAGEGRAAAFELFESMMLRLLAEVPPSKVKFTIIDPVGLGQNFAGFMHLADHDESFVTNRIWTESAHIDQRLSDMTQHMENVIQKYLRNEFETIEQYNETAGEVAEPYRVLVVANFPINFTEVAAKRLMSIVTSGHRCGVITLILQDTQQVLQLPGVNVKDFEAACATLLWQQGRFIWQDPQFEKLKLTVDQPPADDLVTPFVHRIGKKAKEASRVEVPFDMVAPKRDDWWKADSRRGIRVPLGRSGATKFQNLELGRGTSQHVLIAGKTGSGKSTLFHAMITNLALHYSPDELEVYLIDFKKGVEFKVYASESLPHARVIAIESEREFGLSVLQRLDGELKNRAEEFRKAGVQDLGNYRDQTGKSLPRILLLVDEFQEFFVEDDRITQEVSLLLDRLVRQGRAFGIHVLLGSQTIGGAYSLARSTIGQMAVRIALQCSDNDAHMVLSEDNPAARLLSRPGEAIYNDANGLTEGNNLFQVVWLNDAKQHEYLRELRTRANSKSNREPAIVFEGNAPAHLPTNPWLKQLAQGDKSIVRPKAPTAWLGDAIAIKDPTAAVFRHQVSANLAIIGQNAEGAYGLLASSVLSLSAQSVIRSSSNATSNGEESADIFVADGAPVDSPLGGKLHKLCEQLPNVKATVSSRELANYVSDLWQIVTDRQKSAAQQHAPNFLVVYDVQRFRDLKKPDDDFGFTRSGGTEKPSTAKQFQTIIKEGPAVGVHVLLWCDSLANFTRMFDRNGIKDFDMRILFQMSTNDSSTLIDSPAATRLGFHRAFLHVEDEGRLEKFRPYAPPPEEFVDQLVSVMNEITPTSLVGTDS